MTKKLVFKYENIEIEDIIGRYEIVIRNNIKEIDALVAKNEGLQQAIDILEANTKQVDYTKN